MALVGVILGGLTTLPASGAAPAAGSGLPTLAVSDVTVAEGSPATFVITLSAASSQTVTVRFATANGSATAPRDYEPTKGTLTFAAGETSRTVTVETRHDSVPETEEVLYLQLSDASNATISQPQGSATIVDDLPTISISDTTIAEPEPGEINAALFTVTLSEPTSRTVTVEFATADGAAVAGDDYEPREGTLKFRPGEASQTIAIPVRNDGVSSPDAIFFLELFDPENAQLARAAGQATIIDTDRIVSISDTSILQPDPGGEALAVFQVVLSEPTSGSTQPAAGFPDSTPASVDFTTVDGSAVAGEDYVPVSGTLVFRPGESVETIAVPVRNNGVPAFDKTFFLQLFNPGNARLARALGVGTIVGANRVITIDDTTVRDTDKPGNQATFVVSLSLASAQPVSVQYATADGTALAGVDFVSRAGTLVFPPGSLSATINVPLLSDVTSQQEGVPGVFFVDLFDARNGVIARTRAAATIIDHDRFISVSDTSVMADPVSWVDAVFTVSLPEPPGTPVEVDFTTVDGTATAPADYSATTGTLVIGPEETTATITVPVAPQPAKGPDRQFLVRLSGAVNGRVLQGEATGTIIARGRGYSLVGADGGIFSFGEARFHGSTAGIPLKEPIVGLAPSPTGNGYWLVASDGGVFSFGDAPFLGSTGDISLNQPVVGFAATPTGDGYWLVASDGGIFSFGDARFFGSTGGLTLAHPIVGMAPTPTGKGYWLVASDGGVFAFGDARYIGSAAQQKLKHPVIGMAASPSGDGYWLATSDGRVFAFGDAPLLGSIEETELNKPVVGLAASPSGNGYWLAASDGGIFSFGDARYFGSTGALSLQGPIVALARVP